MKDAATTTIPFAFLSTSKTLSPLDCQLEDAFDYYGVHACFDATAPTRHILFSYTDLRTCQDLFVKTTRLTRQRILSAALAISGDGNVAFLKATLQTQRSDTINHLSSPPYDKMAFICRISRSSGVTLFAASAEEWQTETPDVTRMR